MGRRLAAVAAALTCLVAAIAGASGSNAESPHPRVLRALFGSFPDYLDPQLSYTAEGWTAMYDVYVPLLTYRHAGGRAGTEIVPGLARALPRISDDGRTYTLFLRPGLRYSDGMRVRASDFEYAVKRMFKLDSGGLTFYTVIVGARRFMRTGRGGISGIVADNETGKVVIHLVRPTGAFSHLLALMFAAPVPPSTPMRDQSFNPPPATGPYAITRSDLGGWSYQRNPAWEGGGRELLPQLPAGEMDRIDVRVVRDPEAEASLVRDGTADWMQNPPTPRRLALLRRRVGSQVRVEPTPSTYYFWMNTDRPPFDDLRIRRAANFAVDQRALERIYAGQIAPTHQILPPAMPGFSQFDLYPYDLPKARQLVRASRPADRQVTVWTDDESPNEEAGAYFARQLRKIGFRVHLQVLPADFYLTVIGSHRTANLDAGWSDWFADYAHPDDFFRPMLLGSSILRSFNGNFARIDAPTLDARVEALSRRRLGPATERAYAALDRAYMKLAPWVPYGTRTLATFVGKDVDLGRVISNPLFGADLASFGFG